MPLENPDVAIVGGGPAGLSAARRLAAAGRSVVLLERERALGGTPRHCGHLGFGMMDFRRLWTGPRYARALVEAADGLDCRTGHAVTAIEPGGSIAISGPGGPYRLAPTRLLLATGVHEVPRSARLVSGSRPFGVFTAGALQRFVYQERCSPCERPLVVGSELVAFSTILTLRHVGVRPVMIAGEMPFAEAPWPAAFGARHVFRVPVVSGALLEEIHGATVVEGATLRHPDGRLERIACDAVIFAGGWAPEAALARMAGLPVDPGTGGPAIDGDFRTADPKIFAAGNLLRGVRMSGFCAREGVEAAEAMLADLDGRSTQPPVGHAIVEKPLLSVMPQMFDPARLPAAFALRARAPLHGTVTVRTADGRPIHQAAVGLKPWRATMLALPARIAADRLVFGFERT